MKFLKINNNKAVINSNALSNMLGLKTLIISITISFALFLISYFIEPIVLILFFLSFFIIIGSIISILLKDYKHIDIKTNKIFLKPFKDNTDLGTIKKIIIRNVNKTTYTENTPFKPYVSAKELEFELSILIDEADANIEFFSVFWRKKTIHNNNMRAKFNINANSKDSSYDLTFPLLQNNNINLLRECAVELAELLKIPLLEITSGIKVEREPAGLSGSFKDSLIKSGYKPVTGEIKSTLFVDIKEENNGLKLSWSENKLPGFFILLFTSLIFMGAFVFICFSGDYSLTILGGIVCLIPGLLSIGSACLNLAGHGKNVLSIGSGEIIYTTFFPLRHSKKIELQDLLYIVCSDFLVGNSLLEFGTDFKNIKVSPPKGSMNYLREIILKSIITY